MLLSNQQVSKQLIVPASNRLYLYSSGNECTSITGNWIEGFVPSHGASQSKEVDHLYLDAYDTPGGEYAFKTYVTNATVNLDNLNKLKVDWENTGEDHASHNQSGFSIGIVQDGNIYNDSAHLRPYNRFGRRTDELDVSAITGNYYIKVGSVDGSGTYPSVHAIVKVYQIWGEK